MQVKDAQAYEVIKSMTKHGLYLYKRKNSNASLGELVSYQKVVGDHYEGGAVFVSPAKEDLVQGKGYIVTSYETLGIKYNQISHWTPNIFRGGSYGDYKRQYIKGHEKENLKQINVIGFDIDTKDVDLYALFLACDELALGRPNVLLETPRGYQGFFILETPFYIHKQQDYKALRVAQRVADNLLEALSKYVPVDLNCNQFGFYRMPNDENIIYFDDEPINTGHLIEWSKSYEKQIKKQRFHVVYGGKNSSEFQYVSSEWYRTLLNTTSIFKGHHSSSRNNALLTLALANYADGIDYESAYDVLDQWNRALKTPLAHTEFERTLKSAYSGKYKGVKRSYVESLLENWTDGTATFKGSNGWYKFAKPRMERERSHYQEWENDIIAYLNAHTSPSEPFLEGSLRSLSEQLQIPLSSLKETLKKSKQLYKKTRGKGRAASTILATRSMFLNHLIDKRKKEQKNVQEVFPELVCRATKTINCRVEDRPFEGILVRDTS